MKSTIVANQQEISVKVIYIYITYKISLYKQNVCVSVYVSIISLWRNFMQNILIFKDCCNPVFRPIYSIKCFNIHPINSVDDVQKVIINRIHRFALKVIINEIAVLVESQKIIYWWCSEIFLAISFWQKNLNFIYVWVKGDMKVNQILTLKCFLMFR